MPSNQQQHRPYYSIKLRTKTRAVIFLPIYYYFNCIRSCPELQSHSQQYFLGTVAHGDIKEQSFT